MAQFRKGCNTKRRRASRWVRKCKNGKKALLFFEQLLEPVEAKLLLICTLCVLFKFSVSPIYR